MIERNASRWAPSGEAEPELKLEDAVCEACGKTIDRSAMHRVNGQIRCAPCADKARAAMPVAAPIGSRPLGPPIRHHETVRQDYADPALSASTVLSAAVCGLIGALVGAAVWAGFAIAADMSIGVIAVLVGALTGVGVNAGAGLERRPALQLLASGLAVIGLVAAKYIVFAYVVVKVGHARGMSVGYFGSVTVGAFPHALVNTFRPLDLLWLVLAIGAAYRTTRVTTM
jgi:hypothetical protein